MEDKKMLEKIKENPKSIIFTVALVLTIASVLFEENTIVSTALALFTAIFGLDIKNFMQGAVEEATSKKTEENVEDIIANGDDESSEENQVSNEDTLEENEDNFIMD